jgi:hypothetical protein
VEETPFPPLATVSLWRAGQFDQEALHKACEAGHADTAVELVRLGADLNAKNSVRPAVRSYRTQRSARSLRVSKRCGRVHTLILRAPCARVQEGMAAICRASRWGHTATIAELVRLGADINASDKVRFRCGRAALGCPACFQ